MLTRLSSNCLDYMQPALCLLGACPTALTAAARQGARLASDRGVPMIVQWVVREVSLVYSSPQVLLGPVRQRVVLPQGALLVAFEELRLRARGSLLAADAGDPALGAVERALQGGDLRLRAAVLGPGPAVAFRSAGVEHRDGEPEALLERSPGFQRLLEQHPRVDRHDPHLV